jgi:hypothetical protein
MPVDNNKCCTQDFKVDDIVRCVSYNADKSQATVMKQGVIKRTNILGIEDSCQVLFDGQPVPEAFFDEDKCACLQKKVNDNEWTGTGPTTYNTAGQKQ